MTSISSLLALCLVLCSASLTCATSLDRSLKQTCPSPVPTTAQAIDEATRSITSALSTAVAGALGAANVNTGSAAFAQSMTNTYARFIVRHVWRTSVAGVSACVRGPNFVLLTAADIGRATRQGFNGSNNAAARAAATCFAEAVETVAVTATQEPSCQICASNSEAVVVPAIQRSGFEKNLARIFSIVFVAIRNNDPVAAAACF